MNAPPSNTGRLRPLAIRHWPLVISSALLVFLAACTTAPPRSTAPDPAPLAALLVQRLEVARDVAWSKHHTGAPVHDPVREIALLSAILDQAQSAGLPPAPVEALFTAQIAASRQVQIELLAAWAGGAAKPAAPPPDLRSNLRPRLDALTREILAALPPWLDARTDTAPLAETLSRQLADAGFSDEVAALALAPLLY